MNFKKKHHLFILFDIFNNILILSISSSSDMVNFKNKSKSSNTKNQKYQISISK